MRPRTCRILPAKVKAIAADPNYANVTVMVQPLAKLVSAGAGRFGVDVAELS